MLPRNPAACLRSQTSNRLTYESFGEPSSTYSHPRRGPKCISEIRLLLECSSPVSIVEKPGQIGRLPQVTSSYPAAPSSNSTECCRVSPRLDWVRLRSVRLAPTARLKGARRGAARRNFLCEYSRIPFISSRLLQRARQLRGGCKIGKTPVLSDRVKLGAPLAISLTTWSDFLVVDVATTRKENGGV